MADSPSLLSLKATGLLLAMSLINHLDDIGRTVLLQTVVWSMCLPSA